jgi:integrase
MSRPYEIKTKPSGIHYIEWNEVTGEFDEKGKPILKRIRKSCDTRDRKLAASRAKDIYSGEWEAPTAQEKAATAKRVPPTGITMAKLFDHCKTNIWHPRNYKSQATINSQIKLLNHMIGDVLITDMTYARMEQLVEEMFAEGAKPATVDRKLNSVSAALTRATIQTDENGKPWLNGKPRVPPVKVDNFNDRVVDFDEEKAIFAAIEERRVRQPNRPWKRFKHCMEFLIDTGARKGEFQRLVTTNFTERNMGTIQKPRMVWYAYFPKEITKNGKARELPLSNRIVKHLPWVLSQVEKGECPYAIEGMWYMFDNIREDVKKGTGHDIDDVVIHTLRHTCLSRLARTGKVRLEDICNWAGHSNIEITRTRYVHLLRDASLPTLDVLNQLNQMNAN